MSEEEDIDEKERDTERQKLKNLGVESTWDLLTSKKKDED
jgi:hypothetical protein